MKGTQKAILGDVGPTAKDREVTPDDEDDLLLPCTPLEASVMTTCCQDNQNIPCLKGLSHQFEFG
jgi:hypothetical protein